MFRNRRIVLGAAIALGVVLAGSSAQARDDVLTRRNNSAWSEYQSHDIGPRSDRYRSDYGSSDRRERGVYSRDGSRVGTVERNSYGGYTFRGNDGSRR